MTRRELLHSTTAFAAAALCNRMLAAAPATRRARIPDDVVWHDVRDWGLEGRAFNDTESYFDRLPARARPVVRKEVWDLARNTAGMSVRFEADTADVFVRYTLTGSNLAMAHMPATGMSGMDLYAQKDDAWHWIGGTKPASSEVTERIGQGIAPGKRLYCINLPLYNGIKSMDIGLAKSSGFLPIAPRKEKPILFYGTSITQGGCASRPGMAFVAILGRRLNRPMLNFGFSGNGRMEGEVVQFLNELNPAIFVLDCMANMGAQPVRERTEAVVTLLREKHADTPILLLNERRWASGPLVPNHLEFHAKRSAELQQAYENLRAAGVKNLQLRGDENLIGNDSEGTVDGSHPNDLGMMRYADALEPDLRKLL